MQSLSNEQKLELADMQVHSVEIAKVPVTLYDAANKQYVDSQVVAADNRVTAILAGAQPAYDTLIELKSALDSGDSSITTSLTSALGTETANRQAGDTALNIRVDSSHARLTTVEGGLSDEATLRSNADSALGGRIDTSESVHSAHVSQYEADRSLDRQRVTDDIAAQASSDSLDRATAKSLVDTRFTDNEGAIMTAFSDIGDLQLNLQNTTISVRNEFRLADTTINGRIDTAEQRLTDAEASVLQEGSERTQAVTAINSRQNAFDNTLGSHTSSISTLSSDHSSHVSQYESQRNIDRQRVTDDIATQANLETDKNALVLSDLRSEIATESGVRANAEAGLDSRTSALETASSELTELVSANEIALADEVLNIGNALSAGLSEKLNVSEKYAKRLDGNLVINPDAFLYIGNYWRIRASATSTSKRLEFEYSATGANLDFKTAIPFIRGV